MKKFLLWCVVIVCAMFFFLFVSIALIGTISKPDNDRQAPAAESAPPAPAPVDPRDLAMSNTTIANYSWQTDGMTMTATFTFKNAGNVPVKDLEVKCTHSAPSGTVIDSNTRTIYEIIPAGSTKTIRDFNMGFIDSQAARSSCQIQDLALADAGRQ